MKIAALILAILLALLSLAAGFAKVSLVPEELEFLQGFGFSQIAVICYGVLQMISGLLTLVPRSRLAGGVAMAVAFGLSSVLIFMSGNIQFAMVSLIPVVLAVILAYHTYATTRRPAPLQASGLGSGQGS